MCKSKPTEKDGLALLTGIVSITKQGSKMSKRNGILFLKGLVRLMTESEIVMLERGCVKPLTN